MNTMLYHRPAPSAITLKERDDRFSEADSKTLSKFQALMEADAECNYEALRCALRWAKKQTNFTIVELMEQYDAFTR